MSGAGKTTLMDILSGLMLPTSGELAVDGVTIDYNNLGVGVRSRMSIKRVISTRKHYYSILLYPMTI